MKEKIIIFAAGLLSGAIIATGAIFIYTLADNNSQNNMSQMDNGQGMQNEQMNPGGQNTDGGTPPEIPTNNNQTNPQTKSN